MLEKTVVFENELAAAARFALENYTQREIENHSQSNRIKIARNAEDVKSFVETSAAGENQGQKILLGKINSNLAQKINRDANVDLNGYNLELRANEIIHLLNQHENAATEIPRGQRAVTTDDILYFVDIVQNYDSVTNNGDKSLTFVKNSTDGRINAVTLYATGNKSLSLKTMYIHKKGSQTNPNYNVQNDLGMNQAANAQNSLASYS